MIPRFSPVVGINQGDCTPNSTYGELIRCNSMLFGFDDNLLECIRQWFVLLTSIYLIPLLILSVLRLKKAQGYFDFD